MLPLLFSTLRRCPVLDAEGRHLGQLKDLILLPLESLPLVTKLVVLTAEKEEVTVPWEAVARIEREPAAIHLTQNGAALQPVQPRPGEMELGKTLLDRKVVDTKRRKVIQIGRAHV